MKLRMSGKMENGQWNSRGWREPEGLEHILDIDTSSPGLFSALAMGLAEYPKRFMVMDGDMVYTDSRMKQLLGKLPCRSDADCVFFDCTANCNVTSRHCGPRLNDNVDVSAEDWD